MNRVWLRRGGWLLAALVAAGVLAWAFRPQPVAVDVATVSRGEFRKTVDEDGKTRVDLEVDFELGITMLGPMIDKIVNQLMQQNCDDLLYALDKLAEEE